MINLMGGWVVVKIGVFPYFFLMAPINVGKTFTVLALT